MHLPLSEFELHIQPQILERGLQYFLDGRVHDVRPDGDGMILAHVQGSSMYEVAVEVQKDIVKYAECNCLYDKGGPCKHITALLFVLNEGEFKEGIEGRKSKAEKASPKKPAKAKQGAAQKPDKSPKKVNLDTRGLIEAAAPEEIKEWLIATLKTDKSLEKLFKAQFQHYQPAETATEIRQRIRELTTAATKLKGKALHEANRRFAVGIAKWWARCEEALTANDLAQVLTICKIIHEESRSIGDDTQRAATVAKAMDYLTRMAKAELPPKPREQLRIWAEAIISSTGYYYHPDSTFCRIAYFCQPGPEMKAELVRQWTKKFQGKYLPSSLATMMTEMIEDSMGKQALQAYRMENLQIFEFRKECVAELMAAGDHKKAKDMIVKGFAVQHTAGLKISPWWEELIAFYEALNDRPGLVETLMLGYLASHDSPNDFARRLKALVPAGEWLEVRNKLLAKIPDRHHGLARQLLMDDHDLPTLLEYLQTKSIWVALSSNTTLKAEMPAEYAKLLMTVMENEIRVKRDSTLYDGYSEAMMLVEEFLGKNAADEFARQVSAPYPGAKALFTALHTRKKRTFTWGFH